MSLKLKQTSKNSMNRQATKVALFGKLGDTCMTCDKPFNKKDKKQVTSWSVVVREKEGKANLYCPECWDKAKTVVEEFKKHLEEKNDS